MAMTTLPPALALRLHVEEIFFREADFLDERRFDEWLDMFSADLRYRMPMARNLGARDIAKEYLNGKLDVAWLDEGKQTLATRVAQIKTGSHWAEEPPSRTAHIVTNIRILEATPSGVEPQELATSCRFVVYRNRGSDQEDTLIGRRLDRLRCEEGQWKICERTVLIAHSILLSGNLSFFV